MLVHAFLIVFIYLFMYLFAYLFIYVLILYGGMKDYILVDSKTLSGTTEQVIFLLQKLHDDIFTVDHLCVLTCSGDEVTLLMISMLYRFFFMGGSQYSGVGQYYLCECLQLEV